MEYDEEGNLITEDMPKLDADWLNPNTRGRHTLPCPTSAPGGTPSTDATQVPGGAPLRRAPLRKCNEKPKEEFEPSSFNSARIWGQPPASIANLGHSVPSEYLGQTKVTKASLAMQPILQDLWEDTGCRDLSAFITRDHWHPSLVDLADPRILQAKVSKYDADNPSWKDAMNRPFADDFWKACETELETLVNGMETWTLVKRTKDMQVLPGTWAFKVKRFPDGLVKKFKARFCVRGDRQKHGVNYWETWAPVVSWTTIRTVMILAAKEGLVSAQCDITAAFVTAPIPPNEVVYVEQPRGFVKDPTMVCRLNSCLYGMKQSPRYFFGYLTKKLVAQGLVPSKSDPCLFIGKGIILITYVDDLLIYARTQQEIDDLIVNLQTDKCQI